MTAPVLYYAMERRDSNKDEWTRGPREFWYDTLEGAERHLSNFVWANCWKGEVRIVKIIQTTEVLA